MPIYPYENYPDLSLGEFISTEFHQYLQAKKLSFEDDEVNQKEKVIDWMSKQHPYLNTIGCEKLTDVSIQGTVFDVINEKLIGLLPVLSLYIRIVTFNELSVP